MSNEILLDGIVMQKTVDGIDYARCFYCGKFFTPTIVNMELQLFCSEECEKKSDEYWEKVVKDIDW